MADLWETLADLAISQGNAMANLNHALADVVQQQGKTNAQTYRLINKLENRQGEIVEIMKLLVEKVGESKSEE